MISWSMSSKRVREIGLWLAYIFISTTVNATSVFIEYARTDRSIEIWEPFAWEYSSGVLTLLLIPLVLWTERRFPFTVSTCRKSVIIHFGATIPFSIVHVAGMVAIRKVIYALNGRFYDFGSIPVEFLYEWRKDALTYGLIIFVINAYRVFRERADGDANFVPPHATTPPAASSFRVTKGGRDKTVPVDKIEWIEAAGNYVILHAAQDDYMMRATLTALEQRLEGETFIRVHRSSLVNVKHATLTKTVQGKAVVAFASGAQVAVAKRLLPKIRQKWASIPF